MSLLIIFAINSGNDEIILCGIDLNDRKSFYQNKTKYPNLPSFTSSQPRKTRGLMWKEKLMISINEACCLMDNIILKEKNIKVFIQNPKSELIKNFPVYKFKM